MPGGSGDLALGLADPVSAAERQVDKRRRWTDLRMRILSASVLGPLALLCLWVGNPAWFLLVAIGGIVMALEWIQLCGAGTQALPMPAALLAIGGIAYFGLAGSALIWLRGDDPAGRLNALFLVIVVWASDSGAYLCGRLFGGPRLAPRISPAKTWAGAAGGLVLAVIAGLALGVVAHATLLGRNVAAAALLAVVAQAGDLAESFIKRRFGVKDTSRLIPGHGGFLDRLDGVLAAAPMAALLALMLGPGVLLWQ